MEIKVIRSPDRKKTIQARMVEDTLHVYLPLGMQHEEERKLIAQSGHDKVTNIFNARNLWGDIFINIGFYCVVN